MAYRSDASAYGAHAIKTLKAMDDDIRSILTYDLEPERAALWAISLLDSAMAYGRPHRGVNTARLVALQSFCRGYVMSQADGVLADHLFLARRDVIDATLSGFYVLRTANDMGHAGRWVRDSLDRSVIEHRAKLKAIRADTAAHRLNELAAEALTDV